MKLLFFFPLLLAGHSVFSQCVFDYDWVRSLCSKGKYEKAISHCNKSLATCDELFQKASAWYALMEIYRDYMPDDSLYLDARKKLVRSGYETNFRMIDIDGFEVVLPQIDLYYISRELCAELYVAGQYDSALFYFTNYAQRYYEKSRCGVGKEFNMTYDQIMEVRLNFAAGKTEDAIRQIEPYLGIDRNFTDNTYYRSGDRLAIYCYYDIFHAMHLDYKPGDLLEEMTANLNWVSYEEDELRYRTQFAGHELYLFAAERPGTITDTAQFLRDVFGRTTVAHSIRYKDYLLVTGPVVLQGRIRNTGTEFVLDTGTDWIYLPGLAITDENWRYNTVEVSGELEIIYAAVPSSDYMSILVDPVSGEQRMIKDAKVVLAVKQD